MNPKLLSFLDALLQEVAEDPADPEPLFLTKTLAYREFFTGRISIAQFCELFDIEFAHFRLLPRDTTIYYSFRIRPKLQQPFNDRYL